jgi:hypothetical protein
VNGVWLNQTLMKYSFQKQQVSNNMIVSLQLCSSTLQPFNRFGPKWEMIALYIFKLTYLLRIILSVSFHLNLSSKQQTFLINIWGNWENHDFWGIKFWIDRCI